MASAQQITPNQGRYVSLYPEPEAEFRELHHKQITALLLRVVEEWQPLPAGSSREDRLSVAEERFSSGLAGLADCPVLLDTLARNVLLHPKVIAKNSVVLNM